MFEVESGGKGACQAEGFNLAGLILGLAGCWETDFDRIIDGRIILKKFHSPVFMILPSMILSNLRMMLAC